MIAALIRARRSLVERQRRLSAVLDSPARPPYLRVVSFIFLQVALIPFRVAQFFVEFPVHLRAHSMEAFSLMALRDAQGSFLESYQSHVRRLRFSVAMVMLSVVAVSSWVSFFAYSLYTVSQPHQVEAYSGSITIVPTYDVSTSATDTVTDNGLGDCFISSTAYACSLATATTLLSGGNAIVADCTSGPYTQTTSASVMKYDLSGIPSNATITGVQLAINVTTTSTVAMSLGRATSDTPDATSCTDVNSNVYLQATQGTLYSNPISWTTGGTKTYTLGATAISDVQSRISGSKLIALSFYGNFGNRAGAYSSTDASLNKPQLTITYTAPPQAPSGTGHSAQTTNSITWTWTDTATAETRYDVDDGSEVPVTGCTNLAANTQSCTETGLSPNTQYTRHPVVTDANGATDGPAVSVYTAIQAPGSVTSGGASTTTSVVAHASGTISNLGTGLAALFFLNTTNNHNSGWITSTNWTDTGLAANGSYAIKVKARNGDGVETSYTATKTLYAAANPPNVVPEQPASVWTSNPIFLFDDFTSGGVMYPTWDQAQGYAFTDPMTPALTESPFQETATNDGVWYLHIASYDAGGHPSGGQSDLGPFEYDATAPTNPSAVLDGVGSDAAYTTSTTTLSANWTAATDATSGVAKYQYAIGTTSGGTQTLGWTDGTASTNVTKNGLALSDGQIYYVSVRAVDQAGNTSGVATSNGITVDTTAPSTPATVNDGAGSDATYTTSTTAIAANWTTSTDATSGIQKYQYAIGTTSGGTDVVGYTDNGTSTSFSRVGLSLSDGQTYYVSVRAVDGAGNTGGVRTSNGMTVDATAPSSPSVVNDGVGADQTYTNSTTTLSANWTSSTDGTSGIQKYQYAIGTTIGGTDILGYTDVVSATTVTKNSLSLSDGVTYYISVKAVDNAGNISTRATSNGITVVTSSPLPPTVVNDGTSTDVTYVTSTSTLSANWNDATPDPSGLLKYQYAIGTTPNGTNVLAYTDNGLTKSVTVNGLTLTNGVTYYFSVRGVDTVNNIGAAQSSNGATVDTIAPTAPGTVNDGTGADAAFTTSTTTLSANWTASTDATSGIQKYQYAVGTTVGGTDIVAYTDNGLATSVTRTGLSLTNGMTYYISVRAVDVAGNVGGVQTSNGIQVNTALPTITDNQVGDSVARNVAGTTYTVQFFKSVSGPQLQSAEYTVFSGANQTGTKLKNWTPIFSTPVDSYTTPWSVDFSSLQEGTNYISVRATGLDALMAESNDVFTILKDTIKPSILNSVVSVTTTTAQVNWTASEVSTSSISYGLTNAYGTTEPVETIPTTTHDISLEGLQPNTTYHYQITTTDVAGNALVSTDQTFTTSANQVVTTPGTATPAVYSPILPSSSSSPLVIIGLGKAGQTITVYANGKAVGTQKLTGISGTTQSFAISVLLSRLPSGKVTLTVSAKDARGHVATSKVKMTFSVAPQNGKTTLRPTSHTSATYVVKPGDSLWKIAALFYNSGVSYSSLVTANLGTHPELAQHPNLIQPGWVLVVPAH